MRDYVFRYLSCDVMMIPVLVFTEKNLFVVVLIGLSHHTSSSIQGDIFGHIV